MHFVKNFYAEQYLKDEDHLLTRKQSFSRNPEEILFFELEPAVVLDVIRDTGHPLFQQGNTTTDVQEVPLTYLGNKHKPDDLDESYIGRVLVRMCFSEKEVNKDKLTWAIPMENGIKEYPLINEVVIVAKYFESYYYTRKLNLRNFINHNADYSKENIYGNSSLQEFKPNAGVNTFVADGVKEPGIRAGFLGNYFLENHKLRPLKHFEGDTVIEGRNGNSIRFGCFVGDPKIDIGNGPVYEKGHGNPQILIRNNQRDLTPEIKPPGKTNNQPDPFQSPILEDINKDGTSIQITSGKTTSQYKTITKKKLYPNEEQQDFQGTGPSFPKLDGDQIVINTDRLVFSSRTNETFFFSKQRYSIVTDDIFTLDAQKKITITTNSSTHIKSHEQIDVTTHSTTTWNSFKDILFTTQGSSTWNSSQNVLFQTPQTFTINANKKFVVNSPILFLGKDNATSEPILMGQTTLEWISAMFQWIIFRLNYKEDVEWPKPPSIEYYKLSMWSFFIDMLMKDSPNCLSNKVFVTGGGYEGGMGIEKLKPSSGTYSSMIGGGSNPIGSAVSTISNIVGGL